MWWFIVTFLLGIVIGRLNLLPRVLRMRPQWIVSPALLILLCLLGMQIGSQRTIWQALPTLGWQAFVIAAFSMAGSALLVGLGAFWQSRLQRRTGQVKEP